MYTQGTYVEISDARWKRKKTIVRVSCHFRMACANQPPRSLRPPTHVKKHVVNRLIWLAGYFVDSLSSRISLSVKIYSKKVYWMEWCVWCSCSKKNTKKTITAFRSNTFPTVSALWKPRIASYHLNASSKLTDSMIVIPFCPPFSHEGIKL